MEIQKYQIGGMLARLAAKSAGTLGKEISLISKNKGAQKLLMEAPEFISNFKKIILNNFTKKDINGKNIHDFSNIISKNNIEDILESLKNEIRLTDNQIIDAFNKAKQETKKNIRIIKQ